MQNRVEHLLSKEEKKLLGYEFSKEYLNLSMFELQRAFNDVYKDLIDIFRKIFISTRNKSIRSQELKNYTNLLFEYEQNALIKYKKLLVLYEIKKTDVKKANIYLQFNSEDEKTRFFENLNKRKRYLEDYQKNIETLDLLRSRINSLYEKISSSNCVNIIK